MGDDGRPILGSRIVSHDATTTSIHAGSVEEAERLLERERRRALKEGFAVEERRRVEQRVRPTISMDISCKTVAWRRMVAKVALGVGSVVYPPEWRL